jgi:hypothetical protein
MLRVVRLKRDSSKGIATVQSISSASISKDGLHAKTKTTSLKHWFKTTGIKAQNVFLPMNYPHSVAPEYWAYTKWTFVSNVSGSALGGILFQHATFTLDFKNLC